MTPSARILSIGYGQRPMQEFLELLAAHGVEYLIDVRSAPYSRYRRDFGKEALAGHAAAAGLHYAWWGDTLGGRPRDPAMFGPDGEPDYTRMRTLDSFVQAIERLRAAHAQGRVVCLMCGCLRPVGCHRFGLLGPPLIEAGLPYVHILEDASLVEHGALAASLDAGQQDLFAG